MSPGQAELDGSYVDDRHSGASTEDIPQIDEDADEEA